MLTGRGNEGILQHRLKNRFFKHELSNDKETVMMKMIEAAVRPFAGTACTDASTLGPDLHVQQPAQETWDVFIININTMKQQTKTQLTFSSSLSLPRACESNRSNERWTLFLLFFRVNHQARSTADLLEQTRPSPVSPSGPPEISSYLLLQNKPKQNHFLYKQQASTNFLPSVVQRETEVVSPRG